uniref:NADH dehydrogenase [ubiquinone] 1 alpha subcomplex subunit 11 n=1 Tax=Eptatretus burgeri TaxID=7764 RepID=A0A8C4R5B9_EPTBU
MTCIVPLPVRGRITTMILWPVQTPSATTVILCICRNVQVFFFSILISVPHSPSPFSHLLFLSDLSAAMGAVFALGTCLSAQVRNKPDDPLNHFVGGCAAGAMLGMRAHSYSTGTTACAGLGFLAMTGKFGKQQGWRILPTP